MREEDPNTFRQRSQEAIKRNRIRIETSKQRLSTSHYKTHDGVDTGESFPNMSSIASAVTRVRRNLFCQPAQLNNRSESTTCKTSYCMTFVRRNRHGQARAHQLPGRDAKHLVEADQPEVESVPEDSGASGSQSQRNRQQMTCVFK